MERVRKFFNKLTLRNRKFKKIRNLEFIFVPMAYRKNPSPIRI